MFFDGTHRTVYTYSEPVFIEPHTFRLRPRSDPRQTVHEFRIDIDPTPDGSTQAVDAFGNSVEFAWFSGTHDALAVTTRFKVSTHRDNPYDYVLPSRGAGWVWPGYSEIENAALIPYLQTSDSPAAKALSDEAAGSARHELVPFLAEIARLINERCETIVRLEGDPLPADSTLSAGIGSCRDLAVVFIEAWGAPRGGAPPRFVSGYEQGVTGTKEPDLHAWAGAYIPGAGWRGYDPTQGLAVADRHVVLAAAATPAGAAPATGSYRGTGVVSALEASIELHTSGGSPS